MKKKIFAIPVILALILAGAFYIYTADFYHAEESVLETVESGIDVSRIDCGYAVIPQHYDSGIVFYPGAKVEAKAYLPLLEACAKRGILGVLIEMPHNLAFLKVNAADNVYALFPDVRNWYIAGHSMGGAAAAVYADKHSQQLRGVILLAAYSTVDLSGKDLKILSIYGSEDHVLNTDRYNKYRTNLSDRCAEYVIEGGNHAGFGSYGSQKGDGQATISGEVQIEITADRIEALIKG